jgi:hypothetical protein
VSVPIAAQCRHDRHHSACGRVRSLTSSPTAACCVLACSDQISSARCFFGGPAHTGPRGPWVLSSKSKHASATVPVDQSCLHSSVASPIIRGDTIPSLVARMTTRPPAVGASPAAAELSLQWCCAYTLVTRGSIYSPPAHISQPAHTSSSAFAQHLLKSSCFSPSSFLSHLYIPRRPPLHSRSSSPSPTTPCTCT